MTLQPARTEQTPAAPLEEFLAGVERRVERCRQRAETLRETLDEEATCLAQRRLNDLDELLRRKGEQVAALEEAEKHLRRSLQEAGSPAGRSGVRAFLRHAPGHVDRAWQDLEEELQAIQARNEANGRLIHRNLEHTRRLLDLVTGAHERPAGLTYGTQGRYDDGGERSRPITQA